MKFLVFLTHATHSRGPQIAVSIELIEIKVFFRRETCYTSVKLPYRFFVLAIKINYLQLFWI